MFSHKTLPYGLILIVCTKIFKTIKDMLIFLLSVMDDGICVLKDLHLYLKRGATLNSLSIP